MKEGHDGSGLGLTLKDTRFHAPEVVAVAAIVGGGLSGLAAAPIYAYLVEAYAGAGRIPEAAAMGFIFPRPNFFMTPSSIKPFPFYPRNTWLMLRYL